MKLRRPSKTSSNATASSRRFWTGRGISGIEPNLNPIFPAGLLIPCVGSVDSPGAVTAAYAALFAERGGRISGARSRQDAWQTPQGATAPRSSSAAVLGLIALAAIIGPWVAPHPYDRIYPQYVRVPASLEAYPKEDAIVPQFVERARAGARRAIGEVDVTSSTVRAPVSDDEPLDPRIVRYVDRSDLFDNARLEDGAGKPDGRGSQKRDHGRRRASRAFHLRHRRQRPRPAGPHPDRRPRLAGHRPARHPGLAGHRRRLWRDRRLSRRPRRQHR